MPYLNSLQRWARDRGARTAVAVGSDSLGYAELLERASALLPSTGPVSALCQPNSLDLVARFTAGIAGLRAAAVLDPAWPEPVRGAVLARIAVLGAADLPSLALEPGVQLVDGPPESSFLIGLTSGTTSTPKGFHRSRASWRLSFDAGIDYFGLADDDVTLAPGPLAFSLNLYTMAECLYAGSEFRTLAEPTAAAAVQAVADHGVTRLVLVPTMAALMATHALAAGSTAPGLRSIICAGSALDPATVDLLRRWAPAAQVHQYYGASELGFIAAGTPVAGNPQDGGPAACAAPDPAQGAAVGLPFPGVEVAIRGDDGAVLGPGEAGTIHVRSPLISSGYLWGDDGRAFTSSAGWSTVRDKGFLDDAGTLHVLGRDSDMVISSGHNIYPHEVEAVLSRCPGVARVVATGVRDAVRGQRLVAAVAAEPGTAVDAAVLRAAAVAALPAHKRPGRYYSLEALPLTAAGKISRAMLQAWIEEGHEGAHRIF
ncbi:class I adenylate-forming enzyme family protein [Arthrobacter sp. 35W]|uniref:class I adenylate-forming enzyme family protein n=1 Tax=Arthrobacter sp. 35W TaxID=1132441 RepID=UPI000415E040|nr:fatty acid--CoA ligase family protein [Arthrobacter sp. 35W]